ncbi:SDR family oxidoreductase [Aquibium sp. LZ166]|uniref:SDR family oxidoreductase n=1 Tax=Aquibium pacificus TaxID=3153579 RepID=A0ABV3SEU8_9HYPH
METKVALVTGGTAGIGRSVAQVLKRDGWRVAVCARREDRLRELASQGFSTYPCDVSDSHSVEGLISAIESDHGRLDAVVNSAGVAAARQDFVELPDEEVRRLFEINVYGTLSVTRSAIRLLKVNGGTIVNLSSTLARRPRPGSAVYSATKGAIEAFTMALGTEVAKDKIRVHVVAPALVRSEIWLASGMSNDDYDSLLAARGREFPLGRAGEPEDVSELIAYLVSDKARWMTGNLIQVDGGATMR